MQALRRVFREERKGEMVSQDQYTDNFFSLRGAFGLAASLAESSFQPQQKDIGNCYRPYLELFLGGDNY